MTFWDQFKKQLTAIIDLPIEAAQGGAVRRQAYVSPSGTVTPASSTTFTYPTAAHKTVINKVKGAREPSTGRTAYSHGLEKIYSLESVDPKSIRVMGSGAEKAQVPSKTLCPLTELEAQVEFDFGPAYRHWITPCFLLEPLHVLGLSSQTEKLLLGLNKQTVDDLISVDLSSLVHIKGFGQGHIDELETKLRKYIAGRPCHKSRSVDWPAWLRSMTSQLSIKEAKVFLDHFGLGTSIAVPAHIAMELRRASKEEKNTLFNQSLEALRNSKLGDVKARWSYILQALVIPWMYYREGFASVEDLMERLECISNEPEHVGKVLKLLSELTGDTSAFANDLVQVEENLFAVNPEKGIFIARLLELCRSYFYSSECAYKCNELSSWLTRELAKEWVECSQEGIAKLLSYTSTLSSYRTTSGLFYKLNFSA
ncbi:MAG: hypothetical protein WC222_02620 [Parachlamydiales bacterium]|jgi:hypothetical protein